MSAVTVARTSTTDDRPAGYVVRVTAPPEIVCPPWCGVSQAEHVAELRGWEGSVLHRSEGWDPAPKCYVRVDGSSYPDGTPDPENPFTVGLDVEGMLSPDDARAVARRLMEAADLAERGACTGHRDPRTDLRWRGAEPPTPP